MSDSIETLQTKINELQKENERLKSQFDENSIFLTAIDEMQEGLQVIDQEWRYVYLNESAARQGQSDKKSLIGKTMMECYPGIEKTEVFSELQKTMNDRKSRRLENEFKFPNGSTGWFELNIEAHSDGILIKSLDVTERKSLEEKYLHAQKMEAIGLLAGGVAHDFNNKLGVMTIYCGMANELLSDESNPLKKYLNRIIEAVDQSATLTRQLLAFSRKQVLELRPLVLNDLISSVKDSLQKMLGENIEFKVHLDENLYQVKVDSSQMDQVILNLCVNARDAMPDGGKLTIETFNQYFDEEYCESHSEVSPGEYAVLVISDTGEGMDENVLKNIFQPFFTTKELDKGTGLGLSTVFGIVKQCGGHIWVYSEVSMGTTFKVYFPRYTEEGFELYNNEPRAPKVLSGTESILLVEDDDALREAIETSLVSSGYTIYTANDVESAKKIFSKYKDALSLIITDVVLKRSNGYKLAQSFLDEKSELKVLYISGYTENSISHQGVLKDECILLQKPFAVSRIKMLIRQVLDGEINKGVF